MPTLRRHPRSLPGFTLVEAAVSVVIVGVMFVAAITTVASAAQSRRLIAGWRRADGLARALLFEVQHCKYGTTGGIVIPINVLGIGETSRENLDTLDDYAGFTESPPAARDGTLLAGYTNWRRAVSVQRVDPADPLRDTTGSTDKGLKRITVVVRAPDGATTTLTALRSRWSIADLDIPPGQSRALAATLRLRTNNGIDMFAGTMAGNVPAAGAAINVVADDTIVPPVGGTAAETVGLIGGILGGLLGGGR